MSDQKLGIVLFPAGVTRNARGKWVSTDLTAEDNRAGAPGGKLRVLATRILARQYPEAFIITGGARGYDIPPGTPVDRPPLGEILQDELLACGIASNRLIIEYRSNSTYQELQELDTLLTKQEFGRLLLVTSRWHLPRLIAMIESKFRLLQKRTTLEYVAAEDVLESEDSKYWHEIIKRAYNSDFMIQRMLQEQSGIKQIHENTYSFR